MVVRSYNYLSVKNSIDYTVFNFSIISFTNESVNSRRFAIHNNYIIKNLYLVHEMQHSKPVRKAHTHIHINSIKQFLKHTIKTGKGITSIQILALNRRAKY